MTQTNVVMMPNPTTFPTILPIVSQSSPRSLSKTRSSDQAGLTAGAMIVGEVIVAELREAFMTVLPFPGGSTRISLPSAPVVKQPMIKLSYYIPRADAKKKRPTRNGGRDWSVVIELPEPHKQPFSA
jgi:hypothetical protein